MSEDISLENLVAFAILMENNYGIVTKSPEYILEKYRACTKINNPKAMLSDENKVKFDEWVKRWGGE